MLPRVRVCVRVRVRVRVRARVLDIASPHHHTRFSGQVFHLISDIFETFWCVGKGRLSSFRVENYNPWSAGTGTGLRPEEPGDSAGSYFGLSQIKQLLNLIQIKLRWLFRPKKRA